MIYDDDTPEPPPELVVLNSASLLSKFGFMDGDQFDWTYEHGVKDKHKLLIAMVREFILPKLEQKVEVYEIGTIHNPIRAKSVDGVSFDGYTNQYNSKLTPKYFQFTGEEILKFAKEHNL